MGTTTEIVRLVVESIQRGVGQTFSGLQTRVAALKQGVREMNVVFRQSNKAFSQNIATTDANANRMAAFASRVRFATLGLRGFRMELLGVLFFGMAIQRTFFSLLGPSLELFGLFDIFRIMLQTLFLPIAEDVFTQFLDLFDAVAGLDDGTKEAIGAFVLLGGALGSILLFIGILGLGIGSLILAMPTVLEGLVALVAFAGTVVGILFVLDGVKDILAGGDSIVEGLTNIFIGAGFILGGPGLGVALFIMNIGIKMLVDNLTDEATTFKDKLIASLTLAFAGFLARRNVPGAILTFTVALVFQIVFPDFKKQLPRAQELLELEALPLTFLPREEKLNQFAGRIAGLNLTIENNFNGFTEAQLQAALDDRDRRNVDQINRLVTGG